MQDTLITLETAKKAKAKRFNVHLNQYWYNGVLSDNFQQTVNWNNIGKSHVSAPTQSLLQKWLREKHKLHITIFSSSQESWMFRITKPHQILTEGIYGEDFTTYEEALETGLQEALKLI